MHGWRSAKGARLWYVTLFRSTAGHGFQNSMIVLTNLGNRTSHILDIICWIRNTNPQIFIHHKSNSCHKIIYYMKIWTYCTTAVHLVIWKPWLVAVSQTTDCSLSWASTTWYTCDLYSSSGSLGDSLNWMGPFHSLKLEKNIRLPVI